METRGQQIWAGIGLVILTAAASALVYPFWPDPGQNPPTGLFEALTAVIGVAVPVAARLWTQMRRTKTPYLSLDHAADELAKQVRQQWKQAARERGLTSSTSIPVRWRWPLQQVTGSAAAAVRGAGGARFEPLPGLAPITAEELRSDTIENLFGVYGGLDSGRLVLLGKPGSGKSAEAIRLLLDALTHRASLEKTTERAEVPVPVLLTLHDWDPRSELFTDWLAGRLAGDYALVRAREYGPDAATRLINDGHLAVILDALDEMPKELRPVALQELNKQATTFRLVLLTSAQEMVAAAENGHLQGAAALELCPVSAEQAAEYLTSAQLDPAPEPWQRLVTHLREHPDGPLAQALATPLMVNLVRDTYRPRDPVDRLTDYKDSETIENHLLDRALTAAYTHTPPGHPAAPRTQKSRLDDGWGIWRTVWKKPTRPATWPGGRLHSGSRPGIVSSPP